LGTIKGLNGEIILLDSKFYQIKADGIAYPLTGGVKTPFAICDFQNSQDSKLVKFF
jgi:acetolactate decarboxylase